MRDRKLTRAGTLREPALVGSMIAPAGRWKALRASRRGDRARGLLDEMADAAGVVSALVGHRVTAAAGEAAGGLEELLLVILARRKREAAAYRGLQRPTPRAATRRG